MTSLHHWYEGTEALGDVLTETVAGNLEQALFVGCDAEKVFDGLEKVNQIYVQNFIEAAESSQWSNLEPWTCYLEKNSVLGSGLMPATHVPTLFVVSELDELVYAPSQRTEFELLCAAGYQLDYLECLGASHAHGAVFSLPEQFDWVAERLAGQPIPISDLCVIEQARYCSADPDAP
ncbi:MAG: hypothetical protein JRF33_27320 [Deltaproteobacteria bacterium]|nr:hypothetical protein [Deltaproteobacteria bacterium]